MKVLILDENNNFASEFNGKNMLKLGKVEKFSFRYAVLKLYTKFAHNVIFYEKVQYDGVENIPTDKPVLIAPNHQNALMDALAIIFAFDKQPVFLARSDIFKNPLVARILYFLKILPVFRLRDGKEKLKYNEQIYRKTMQVLANRPVVIFPEAQHIDKRHLRKLKKGIQRIAFMLEEESNFTVDVHIVPAGIYYSNYWNFRSKLFVSFGKPIRVEDYKDDYKQDPVKAMIKLGNDMHEKIREQIIHIKNLKNHDEYNFLLDICDRQIAEKLGLNEKDLKDKIQIDKETVRRVDKLKEENPEKFEKLLNNIKEYKSGLNKFRLKDWVLEQSGKGNNFLLSGLILLLGFPIFIYGFVNNIIPYFLPGFITKKLKDRQFESSIVFGAGIFTYPVFYVLQSLIVWFVTKSWIFTLSYFISLPVAGLLAFMYSRLFVKTSARYRFAKKKNDNEMIKLLNLRKIITDVVNNIK